MSGIEDRLRQYDMPGGAVYKICLLGAMLDSLLALFGFVAIITGMFATWALSYAATNGNGESDEDEFGTDIDNPDKSMSRGQRSLSTLPEQTDDPSPKDLNNPEDENANEQLFVEARTPAGSESEGSCDEYADVSETLPHPSDGGSTDEICFVKNESHCQENIYQDLARQIVSRAIDSAVVDFATKMGDPREESSPSPTTRLCEVDQASHDAIPLSGDDVDIKRENTNRSPEQNDEGISVPFGDSINDGEDGMQTPECYSSQVSVGRNETDMTDERVVSEISYSEESSVSCAGEGESFSSDGTSVTVLSTSYGIVQSKDVPNAPVVKVALDDEHADVESDDTTTSSEADTVKDAGKDIAAREALLEIPDSTESTDDVDVAEDESCRSHLNRDDDKDETANAERQQIDSADVSELTDGTQGNKVSIPEIKIDTVEDRVGSDDEEKQVVPADEQSDEIGEIETAESNTYDLAYTSENDKYPTSSQTVDHEIIVPLKASTVNPRDLSEVLTSLTSEDIPVVSDEEEHIMSVDPKDGLLECMTALEGLNMPSVDEESSVRDQNNQISEDVIAATVAKADESSRIPLSTVFAPENENVDIDVSISTTDQDADINCKAETLESSSDIRHDDKSGYEAVNPAHDDVINLAISRGDTSQFQDDLCNTEKDDRVYILAGGAEATLGNDQSLLDYPGEEDILEQDGQEKQTVTAEYDDQLDDSREGKASDHVNITKNAEYPTSNQTADIDFKAETLESMEECQEASASEDEIGIPVTSKEDPHRTQDSDNFLNNDAGDESSSPVIRHDESGYVAVDSAHDDAYNMATGHGDTSQLQDNLSNTGKDEYISSLPAGAEATLLYSPGEGGIIESDGQGKQTVIAGHILVDDSGDVKASDLSIVIENAEYPIYSQTVDPEIIVPLKASTVNPKDLSGVLTSLTGEDIAAVSGEDENMFSDHKEGLLICMTALDDLSMSNVDEVPSVRDHNDQISEDVIATALVKSDESSRIPLSSLFAPENETLFDADDLYAAETLDTREEKLSSEDERDAPVTSAEEPHKTPAVDETDKGGISMDTNETSSSTQEAPPCNDKSHKYREDDVVCIDAGKGINHQISVRELLMSLDGETPPDGDISEANDSKPRPGKRVITDEMVREAIAFLMTKPFFYSYGMYDSQDNIFYTYDYDDLTYKGERTFALVRAPSDDTTVKSTVSAVLSSSRLKNHNDSLDINHVDEVVQKEHKDPNNATSNLHDLLAVLDNSTTDASDPQQPVTEEHFDVENVVVEEAVPEMMEPDHITHSDDDSSTASSSQTSGTYILDNGIIEEEDTSLNEEVPSTERELDVSKTSSHDREPTLNTRPYRSPSPGEYETRQREPDREQPKAGRVFFITSAMLAQLSEQQAVSDQENGFHRPHSSSASSESGSSESYREYPPGYNPMSDPTWSQEHRMVETARQEEETPRGGYPQNVSSADYDSEEGPMRFRPIPNHVSLVEPRERSPVSSPQGNQQIVYHPQNDQPVSDYDSTPELLEIENRKHRELPPSSYYNEPHQKTNNGLGEYDDNDENLHSKFRPVKEPTATQSADETHEPTASPVPQATESRPHAVFSIRGRVDDAAHSEAELVPGANSAYHVDDIHDIHGEHIVPEHEPEAFASHSDINNQELHHQSEDNILSHSDYLGSASSSDNEYEVDEGDESFASGERMFAVVGAPGDTTAITVIGAIEVYRSEEDMGTQKSLFSYEISRGRAGPDGKIKRLLEQSITFEHHTDEQGVTEADGKVQEEPTGAGYSTEDSFANADLQLELPCDSMGEELSDREGLQRQVSALDNLLSEKTLELQSFKDDYPWLDRLLTNPKETLPGHSEAEIVGLMQVYKQLEEEVLEYMNIYKETKIQLTELIEMQRS